VRHLIRTAGNLSVRLRDGDQIDAGIRESLLNKYGLAVARMGHMIRADTEALPHWRNAREGFDAAGIRIGGALAKRTSMLSR
jgi:hypothetical protein